MFYPTSLKNILWRKEIKRKKLKNISYHDTCKKNAITDDAYNALDM